MFKKMRNCDDIFQWPDHKGDEKRPPLPALLKTRFCLLSSSSFTRSLSSTLSRCMVFTIFIIHKIIMIIMIVIIFTRRRQKLHPPKQRSKYICVPSAVKVPFHRRFIVVTVDIFWGIIKNAKNANRCARWWNDFNIEHTLNILWTYSKYTLNVNIPWTYSEHSELYVGRVLWVG